MTDDLQDRLERSLGARYAIGDLVGRGGWAALGEKQRALDLIDRAVAQHARSSSISKSNRCSIRYVPSPRFQALMHELNFTE